MAQILSSLIKKSSNFNQGFPRRKLAERKLGPGESGLILATTEKTTEAEGPKFHTKGDTSRGLCHRLHAANGEH